MDCYSALCGKYIDYLPWEISHLKMDKMSCFQFQRFIEITQKLRNKKFYCYHHYKKTMVLRMKGTIIDLIMPKMHWDKTNTKVMCIKKSDILKFGHMTSRSFFSVSHPDLVHKLGAAEYKSRLCLSWKKVATYIPPNTVHTHAQSYELLTYILY